MDVVMERPMPWLLFGIALVWKVAVGAVTVVALMWLIVSGAMFVKDVGSGYAIAAALPVFVLAGLMMGVSLRQNEATMVVVRYAWRSVADYTLLVAPMLVIAINFIAFPYYLEWADKMVGYQPDWPPWLVFVAREPIKFLPMILFTSALFGSLGVMFFAGYRLVRRAKHWGA